MPAPYATPGEAIFDRLNGETAAGSKVFPQKPTLDPQGKWVVYRKQSGGGGKRLGGRNALQSYSFRLDCFATTQEEAESLYLQVLSRLAGWNDRVNGIHGCFESEDHDDDLAEDGNGKEYRVSGATFELWFMR